jgi:exodeoxyribonuclease-3
MKLISWNVNGIRAIHRKGTLAELMKQEKPAIVCLQETKAEQHQSEVDLPDYEEYWNSSKGRKGYSGVAIFSKEVPISVRFDFPTSLVKRYHLQDGYGDLKSEGRVIVAEYKDFFVVNCYTPNAKPDLSRLEMRHKHWDPAFLAYCKELETEKPVIFCGDLNVAHTPDDLAKPKENEGDHGFTKEQREGVDNMLAAGFVDTFRLFHTGNGHYTWWSNFGNARARNVGWRIDYFFVSRVLKNKVKAARILPEVHGSDHCPIELVIGE